MQARAEAAFTRARTRMRSGQRARPCQGKATCEASAPSAAFDRLRRAARLPPFRRCAPMSTQSDLRSPAQRAVRAQRGRYREVPPAPRGRGEPGKWRASGECSPRRTGAPRTVRPGLSSAAGEQREERPTLLLPQARAEKAQHRSGAAISARGGCFRHLPPKPSTDTGEWRSLVPLFRLGGPFRFWDGTHESGIRRLIAASRP